MSRKSSAILDSFFFCLVAVFCWRERGEKGIEREGGNEGGEVATVKKWLGRVVVSLAAAAVCKGLVPNRLLLSTIGLCYCLLFIDCVLYKCITPFGLSCLC